MKVSEASFNADERRRHEKVFEDCRRIFKNNRDDDLAGDCFTKENVKSGSDSSVSGTGLYTKRRLADFQKTDGDAFVARRLFQLSRSFPRDEASFWYTAWPEDTKTDARERDGVEKQQSAVEKWNQRVSEIVRKIDTDLL